MKYKIYVSEINYGSVTVEADSEEEAKDKFYNSDVRFEVEYYDSEISDVDVQKVEENGSD